MITYDNLWNVMKEKGITQYALIKRYNISPAQISNYLNFYSLPYFYKVFKSHTGVTPHQYRDQFN